MESKPNNGERILVISNKTEVYGCA